MTASSIFAGGSSEATRSMYDCPSSMPPPSSVNSEAFSGEKQTTTPSLVWHVSPETSTSSPGIMLIEPEPEPEPDVELDDATSCGGDVRSAPSA